MYVSVCVCLCMCVGCECYIRESACKLKGLEEQEVHEPEPVAFAHAHAKPRAVVIKEADAASAIAAMAASQRLPQLALGTEEEFLASLEQRLYADVKELIDIGGEVWGRRVLVVDMPVMRRSKNRAQKESGGRRNCQVSFSPCIHQTK